MHKKHTAGDSTTVKGFLFSMLGVLRILCATIDDQKASSMLRAFFRKQLPDELVQGRDEHSIYGCCTQGLY